MTAANMTAPTAPTAPTAEAIQEALEFLRVLSERKPSPENTGTTASDSAGSDIFKTIEAALKICSEAKDASAHGEDDLEEDDGNASRKKHAACSAGPGLDAEDEGSDDEEEEAEEEDEEEEDEDEEEDDNPFAGDYYWCPGSEWKAIGLVAGGAALVGLGALLYKLFDD